MALRRNRRGKSSRRRVKRSRRTRVRRVGRVMRQKVKAVVRSMEYTKMERELARTGAEIPCNATGILNTQASWNRLIPKIQIGFRGDERPYATVKPIKLLIDLRIAWLDNFQRPVDLTVVVYVLTAKQLKRYTGVNFDSTGFPNFADFLQADGKTACAFDGSVANQGELYFKSNYPINQNCTLIKKFKFRMVKGLGTPYGALPGPFSGYQPVPQTNGPYASEAPPSGPLQMQFHQAIYKRFSIPLPSVLRYEMEVSPNPGPADALLPVNYAPCMAIGFFDNATGPLYEGGAPVAYNYEMKLTYKDL